MSAYIIDRPKLTRHERCLVRIAELEFDLFGELVSDSVMDDMQRLRWCLFDHSQHRSLRDLAHRLVQPDLPRLIPTLPDPGQPERR